MSDAAEGNGLLHWNEGKNGVETVGYPKQGWKMADILNIGTFFTKHSTQPSYPHFITTPCPLDERC
jgi:hypothetical protein